MKQLPQKHSLITLILVSIVLAFGSLDVRAGQVAPNVRGKAITSSNAANLKLVYLLNGYCDGFSPDGRFVRTLSLSMDNSIVDLHTGDKITPADTFSLGPFFSGNSRYIYVVRYGIFDLRNPEKQIPLGGDANRGIFSSDSRSAVLYSYTRANTNLVQIYDMETWRLRFEVEGSNIYYGVFSPDSRSILVGGEGLFDVFTGKKLFTIERNPDPYASWNAEFDPTGSFVAISSDGVYDVKSGERKFKIGDSTGLIFSPDGKYLAIQDEGVYEVESGKRILAVAKDRKITFAPDGSHVIISGEGIYSLPNGEQPFTIKGFDLFDSIFAGPIFSPDGNNVALPGDGVYSLKSGERLFIIGFSFNTTFSPDGSQLIASGSVYEVAMGAILYKARIGSWGYQGFNEDGTLIIGGMSDLVDSQTGKRRFRGLIYSWLPSFSPNGVFFVTNVKSTCAVFAISDDAPRGFIIVERGVNIRRSPSFDALFIRSSTEEVNQFIYARTPDSNWYRIGDREWVSTSVVTPVYIPDNLPVETG